MTIRFLSILGFTILLFSCKKTEGTSPIDSTQVPVSKTITENDISQIDYTDYVLDSKTEAAIESWLKYQEFADVVAQVKKGDLSYFHDNDRENIIRNYFIALKKAIPDTVNTPAVLARVLVLETKTYKLESLSNFSTTTVEELNQTIKEFLVSFSNLNLQMNKKMEKDSQIIEKP